MITLKFRFTPNDGSAPRDIPATIDTQDDEAHPVRMTIDWGHDDIVEEHTTWPGSVLWLLEMAFRLTADRLLDMAEHWGGGTFSPKVERPLPYAYGVVGTSAEATCLVPEKWIDIDFENAARKELQMITLKFRFTPNDGSAHRDITATIGTQDDEAHPMRLSIDWGPDDTVEEHDNWTGSVLWLLEMAFWFVAGRLLDMAEHWGGGTFSPEVERLLPYAFEVAGGAEGATCPVPENKD